MTNYVTQKVAKRVLTENAANHFASDDPYYEQIALTDREGRPTGKTIKRRRPPPPGLTKQEEKVLKKVTNRAHRLDTCINICGIRVGWEAIIGIIPWIGDAAGSIMALTVVHTCEQVDIPPALKSKMLFNVVIDFFIGLVPFLGDVADAFYRCNTRNAALLYKHLQQRGSKRLRQGQEQREGSQTRRDKRHSRPELPEKAGPLKEPSDPSGGPKSHDASNVPNSKTITSADMHGSASSSHEPPHNDPGNITMPQPTRSKTSKEKTGGWLSRLGRSQTGGPEPDLEHDGHGDVER